MPTPRQEIATDIARGCSKHGLTGKQSELAVRYVLDADVSGNKTQSALTTYDTQDKVIAFQIAHSTLQKPHVQTFVQELLEDSGFGVEVRSARLAKIGLGRARTKKSLVQKNKNGEIVSQQEITSDVPVSVQLKAIAEANKVEGRYEQAAATVRMAEKEYTAQRKKLLREAGLTQ